MSGPNFGAANTAQIVYYDGQFNDARLNVALACTAALAGATVVNHAKVTKLLKVCPFTLGTEQTTL
jgi:glycerol-3-phosphate dehydrogenase